MIHFGCDYYPEQWRQWLAEGETRWQTDAQMMAEAGFNTVRLAEFAWGLLEAEPDRFDFGWLDRAIDVLHAHGLEVVLSTPTPGPPSWLLAAHPDITQVDEDGRRLGPGTRREACANHPAYQERSRIIVERLATHYGGHPGVIGWQTDNEFGCHGSARCYCPHCQAAFRVWLREKFRDLETLNRAWGTAFWGEVYAAWEEIPAPTSSRAERNPSHILDFQRFSSDVWRDYHAQQIAILRQHCPDHFVTHNLMGFFPDLNAYDLSEGLDFVSWDNYHYLGATPATVAASHDHMRGVLRRNFWVMEQQVGQINWSVYNPAPPPNFVRLKTYQAIAHGADGVIYFRWRQALAGSEQYHSGLLDHTGRATLGYGEARQIGDELQRLAPLLRDTGPDADVAILLDYDSRWVLEQQPHNQVLRMNQPPDFVLTNPVLLMDREDEPDERFMTGRAWLAWQFLAPYIALWEDNIPAAIVSPEADLSSYRVVLAPFLDLLRPAVVSNLRAFVEGGGALVVGPRSGVKDEYNRLFTVPQPGPLAELTGSAVRFFDSLSPDRHNELRWLDTVTRMGRVSPVGLWAEILEPGDRVDVLACYTEDWYANEPAVTRKQHPGGGQAIHVGCMGGPTLYHTLFDWLLPQVDIAPLMASIPGVEVCARHGAEGKRILFLLNHTGQSQELSLANPAQDVLSGERFDFSITLQPGEVRVIHESK